MRKINATLLMIIAICLAYIAFLKPLPQRYVIKEEEKTGELTHIETVSVFDTATGRQYKKM